MSNSQQNLKPSSVRRIVTEQKLKQMKIEYLEKHGFRRSNSSWSDGNRRIRNSLVEDGEMPLSVFINIVNKSIQGSKNKKNKKASSKKKRTSSNKKRTSQAKHNFDIEKSQDALDYRLPGSYGTGKRR